MCVSEKNGHVDEVNLPADFVTELVEKLKSGVDFMVRSEYPARGVAPAHQLTTQGSSDNGPANKRPWWDT
jgi:hypothetical protein